MDLIIKKDCCTSSRNILVSQLQSMQSEPFSVLQPFSPISIYFGTTLALNDWNCSHFLFSFKTEFSAKEFHRAQIHMNILTVSPFKSYASYAKGKYEDGNIFKLSSRCRSICKQKDCPPINKLRQKLSAK